jgi:hypothetical protein
MKGLNLATTTSLISIKDRLRNCAFFTDNYGADLTGYHSAFNPEKETESARIIKGGRQLYKDFNRGLSFKFANNHEIKAADLLSDSTTPSSEAEIDAALDRLKQLIEEKDPNFAAQLPALFKHYMQDQLNGLGGFYIYTLMFRQLIVRQENTANNISPCMQRDEFFYTGDDGRLRLKLERNLGFKSTIDGQDMFHKLGVVEESYIFDNERGFQIEDIKFAGHQILFELINLNLQPNNPPTAYDLAVQQQITTLMMRSFEYHQRYLEIKAKPIAVISLEKDRLESEFKAAYKKYNEQVKEKPKSVRILRNMLQILGILILATGIAAVIGFVIAGPFGVAIGAAIGAAIGLGVSSILNVMVMVTNKSKKQSLKVQRKQLKALSDDYSLFKAAKEEYESQLEASQRDVNDLADNSDIDLIPVISRASGRVKGRLRVLNKAEISSGEQADNDSQASVSEAVTPPHP